MKAPPQGSPAPRTTGCNILQPLGPQSHLWQFSFRHGQAHLQAESPASPLPRQVTARAWRQLFQPRLNLAWLPPEQVYVRIIRLPAGDPHELASMVELQLEKISPLPLTQMVWSYEVWPDPSPDQRTVVVLLATRTAVEEHLGRLEAAGFLADRLELPLLHRVMVETPDTTCVRLHLESANGRMACLAAWWHAGQLTSLDLVSVPDDATGPGLLVSHLNRLVWAAELDGGLETTPHWHLVVARDQHADWIAALREWAGDVACSVHDAPAPRDLATLAARRTASGAARTNLLPAETSVRYRQQFLDRLWMRSLAAAVVLYLLGVVVYAARVKVDGYRSVRLSQEAAQLAPAFTNAVQLKERLRVFQEQAGLKYAALNCLLAVSERLPSELTLESFSFESGNRLFLAGTVPSDAQAKVTEFNADLRKAMVDRELLFEEAGVDAPKFAPRANNTYRWDFAAKLKSPWQE